MGGFAISSALKGLFSTKSGGLDGLSDIYLYNLDKKSITRLDDPEAPLPQVHPWHIVSQSK